MEELTLGVSELMTVAGAAAAALIVAQFAKKLFRLSPGSTRTISMLTGLIIVVVATVQSNGVTSILSIILAVVVGMQAGLAASATFDTVDSGLNHSVDPAVPQPAADLS
jgi:hypothetical protein